MYNEGNIIIIESFEMNYCQITCLPYLIKQSKYFDAFDNFFIETNKVN